MANWIAQIVQIRHIRPPSFQMQKQARPDNLNFGSPFVKLLNLKFERNSSHLKSFGFDWKVWVGSSKINFGATCRKRKTFVEHRYRSLSQKRTKSFRTGSRSFRPKLRSAVSSRTVALNRLRERTYFRCAEILGGSSSWIHKKVPSFSKKQAASQLNVRSLSEQRGTRKRKIYKRKCFKSV